MSSDHSTLVRHAQESGAACPRCGYSLSGLRSDQCPECGTKLVLSVTTLGLQAGSVSARFVLWWCIAYQLAELLGYLWRVRVSSSVLAEIMGRSVSSYPYWDFLVSVLKQGGTLEALQQFWSISIALFAAYWLLCLHRYPASRSVLGCTPFVCKLLLILVIVDIALYVF